MSCKTRRESDEMVCACGLRWEVNDPEPPTCPTTLAPARHALAEYNATYAAGGELAFPQWAADLLAGKVAA